LDSEAEHNLLGGALSQWNDAAQMIIAHQLQFSLALEHFLHIATADSSSSSSNNIASVEILQACENLEQLNCPQLFEHATKMLRCLLFSIADTDNNKDGTSSNNNNPSSPAPNEAEMAEFNANLLASTETLNKVGEEVKYWLRKNEKQAEDAPPPITTASTTNGTPSPPPIPRFFSNALQLLWSLMETKYIPKYESFQVDLRSLVCRRYQAVDQSLLAAVSDSLGDGDRLPAQDMPGYDKLYGDMIRKSNNMVGELCGQEEMRQAVRLLYSLEHLLLANQGHKSSGSGALRYKSPSSVVVASVVDVNVQQMILMAVVETLLEGNAPSIAVPLLTDIFQETLKESAVIKLDADTKLKLIPRIVRALTGSGSGSSSRGHNSNNSSGSNEGDAAVQPSSSWNLPKGRVLKDKDAVVLLKATLDPDALLESGRLSEFQFVFLLLLKHAQESSSKSSNMANAADAVAPLLRSFDTLRFAILAMQHQASSRQYDDDAISSDGVSFQSVMDTAAQCLLTSYSYSSGTEAAGTSIVDGVLSAAPIEAYAACLALALHTPSPIARSCMLSMLGAVPTDMLSEYTIVEIWHQVAAALEDNRLKPGELPHAMVGALFKSIPVMSSLHAALYNSNSNSNRGGAFCRHGGSSSAALQNVWTAQILHDSNDSMDTSSSFQAQQKQLPIIASMSSTEAEEAIGGSSSVSAPKQHASSSSSSSTTLMSSGKQKDVLPPKIRLMHISRSNKTTPSEIFLSFDTFLRAWLQSIIRHGAAGTSESDALLSESLGNLLMLLFEPAAEQGAWMLEWIWKVAYLKHLHAFLSLASAATGSSTAMHVFRQYWASLPWKKATFHLDGVSELSRISTVLLSSGGESRAAAELLHALDWAPIIAKCPTPGDFSNNNTTTTSAPLICLDEEEEETQLGLSSAAAIWAANLSLLALRAGILFPKQDLPPWLQLLVYGDNIGALVEILDAAMLEKLVPFLQQAAVVNKQQQRQGRHGSGGKATPLSILLQYSDWPTLHAVFQGNISSCGNCAPWLLLPVLACSKIIDIKCGSRLAHIATVLAEGAFLNSSTTATQQQYQAPYVASAAIQPVLLSSVCHGSIVPQPKISYQDHQQQQQQLPAITLPDDIPAELLEGTEEGRRLKLQQEQEQFHPRQRNATSAVSDGFGCGGNASARSSSELKCIELSGCFRLSVKDHSYILSNAILPLAQKAASIGFAPKIIDNSNNVSSFLVSNADSRVKMWQPMSEDEEEQDQQLMATMTPVGEHSSSPPPLAPPLAISKDEAAIATIKTLLAAVSISSASTYLTLQPVAECSNADVPWDQEAALFLSSDGRPISPPSSSLSSSALFGNGLVKGLSKRFTGFLGRMHAADSNGEGSLMTGDASSIGIHHNVDEHSITSIDNSTQLVNWLCMIIWEHCCNNDDVSDQLLLYLVRLIYVASLSSPSESTSQLAEALYRHLKTAGSAAEGREGDGYEALFAFSTNNTAGVLNLATQFTTFRCPLLASATLKTLRTQLNGDINRGGEVVVVDKKSWQETIARVIEIAASVSESPDINHPVDIVCVWFEMLQWLASSTWKRLPPTGPHISAVGVVIVVLEGRATALQQSLLTMKHHEQDDDHVNYIQEVAAAEGESNISNGGGDNKSSQFSSSSSSSSSNDLGVKAAKMVEKAGKNVKSSWSNFRESLKSKDGKGGHGSGVQSHPVTLSPEKEQKPGSGGGGGGGGSFKHLRSISETEAMQEYQEQRQQQQQSQSDQEHSNKPPSLSSTFNTQKLKKIVASIGYSIPLPSHSDNKKPLVLTQKQSEELKLALIAAAVAGFIRSVLCPDISSRGSHSGSGTPGTPSHTDYSGTTNNRVKFHHRTTSSVGREEAMMTAMDNVVENQGLVDSCEVLIERLGGRGRAPVILLEYQREIRSLVSPGMSVNELLEGLNRFGLIEKWQVV